MEEKRLYYQVRKDIVSKRARLRECSVSMFYLVGLFDLWSGLWTLSLSAAFAYGIAATMKDPLMPWIAFAVLMGHMSVSHLYRQWLDDASVVDVTGKPLSAHLPAYLMPFRCPNGARHETHLLLLERPRRPPQRRRSHRLSTRACHPHPSQSSRLCRLCCEYPVKPVRKTMSKNLVFLPLPHGWARLRLCRVYKVHLHYHV